VGNESASLRPGGAGIKPAQDAGGPSPCAFWPIAASTRKHFPRWIEDIELGYRLRAARHRIRRDRDLQGTHLKQWSLLSVIRTDVTGRAVPWARLILWSRNLSDDLNLKLDQRVSSGLVGLASILIVLSPLRIELLAFAAASLTGVLLFNRGLFQFLRRERGLMLFAAACIPLHLRGLSYGYVWEASWLGGGRLGDGHALAAGRVPWPSHEGH
jgi:hypothetical protein